MVDRLSVEQLQDEEIVSLSSSFQTDRLVADEEQTAKFASFVREAAAKKIEAQEGTEEVEVDESDLDDFDTSALYL